MHSDLLPTEIPSPAAQRRSEYRALALMYISQGLPVGFAFNGLAALIRSNGYSVAHVGLIGLAILPWAFKFLWASAIDNACTRWGHARIIFTSQALATLCCLLLIPLPPSSGLAGVIACVVLFNLVCATQDIATNAYAVTRMQGKAAGPANAIQIAGFIGGMLLGGGGMLILHSHTNWHSSIAALAGILALLGLLLWLDKGWQGHTAIATRLPRVRLRGLLRHRDLFWAALIALSFKFPSTAVGTLVQPWLVDHGIGLEGIGQVQIVTMTATALGGIVLGVPLVRRLGNRRAVICSYTLAALVLGAAWHLETAGPPTLLACFLALGIQAFFEGAAFVAIWALFMNWSSQDQPGTDFTAMQCGENLSNVAAAGVIGGLGQAIGYGQAFALAWAMGGLCLIVILLSVPRMQLAGTRTA